MLRARLKNSPQGEQERRYSLTSSEAWALIAKAESHLALDVYDERRPVAYSLTTYYDSVDSKFYEGAKNGVNQRVRVRQYAASENPDSHPVIGPSAYLEFKESVGVSRRKLRYASDPVALAGLLAGTPSDEQEKDLQASSPELYEFAIAIRSGELVPVFSTWYRRLSMSDREVRLTIDENVTFCGSMPLLPAGEPASQNAPFDLVSERILEVKHEAAIPEWLKSTVESLSRAEIPSKFHRGMVTLRSSKRRSFSATRPLHVHAAHRP